MKIKTHKNLIIIVLKLNKKIKLFYYFMKITLFNQLPNELIIYINNYIPIKKCEYCSNNIISYCSCNVYCSYYCYFINKFITFSFNNYYYIQYFIFKFINKFFSNPFQICMIIFYSPILILNILLLSFYLLLGVILLPLILFLLFILKMSNNFFIRR